MTNLTYNGQVIEQRDIDGYVNATQMCQANGKLIADWLRTKDTKRYFEAVSVSMGIPIDNLIYIKEGRPERGGGTWVHPKLAIKLARWISVDFELWCDEHIRTLIETGKTVLTSTAERTKPGCLLAYEERVLQLPQNLKVPYGYWAVLKQSAYLLLHVEQVLNCPVDRADLLDGSIGKMWASWRKDKQWAKPVKTGSYKYPDGRWCEPNCYEWSELGYFSEFIEGTYTPIHLPRYLEKKYPGIVKV